MTATTRQNNLLLNQDWKRIYQTFKNADFKSYDFENLRRVIITYVRENYPEDFNDYIESSEYMALIDAIAFVGQSLAFRIDLNSRENFIELAETKESVLRLARLLGYTAKRNIPASGLLKFDTITTTDNVLDSNGRDLANQTIIWNDPTNPNWFEQFILIINSALSDNTEFGRSQGSAIIQGIPAEQYRFRSRFDDVPLFNFDKTVANRRSTFELVSTSFKDKEDFYEESPLLGRELGFVYRQDGKGAGSNNTGFFLLLKQGSLELTDFAIDVPTTNEIISVDVDNINDSDVWLYQLDSLGLQQTEWTKVAALSGNNIAYNSLSSSIRNIYNVISKEGDAIDLVFADGVYGNLPRGSFRVFYRVSNNQSYVIKPNEMRGININIPYLNQEGIPHELTISLSLKYTISNAAISENIDDIRVRAPALYYTQNRMVTAEDYNLAPLSSSQDIIKIKSINRTASGISRNYDIIDATGKYSSVNVFADDGIIYKQEEEIQLGFKYADRLDIINFIRQSIEPQISATPMYNFYLTKFEKVLFPDTSITWNAITDDVNQSTGYFVNTDGVLQKTGVYTNNTLKFLTTGSLIKFVPPTGKAFKNGALVDTDPTDPQQLDRIWAKAVRIVGDGTNAGRGVLANGLGPVVFNDIIPTGAIAQRIVPRFVTNLSDAIELEMINLMSANFNFGLRYDPTAADWKIITASNLNLVSDFNLGFAGDNSNSNLDASWTLAFVRDVNRYVVRIRNLDYVFGSLKQNSFYYDVNQKTYDSKTGRVVKDQIKVLGINTDFQLINELKTDLTFEVSDTYKFEDGYESAKEIKIAFSDSDSDGIIDNPDAFEQIVGEDLNNSYLFFQKTLDENGNSIYQFVDNSDDLILIRTSRDDITISDFNDGQLIYFTNEDERRVMQVDLSTNTLLYRPEYRANIGRDKLKFHYIHNANADRRIDPSSSNIMDVYLLTRNYDTEYRNFLQGISEEPELPTSEQLRIAYGAPLNLIKTVSDEIIYHPVKYKVLFGKTAEPKLQAVFKVVKNVTKSINDNDLKVRIITAMNEFFDVNNWDFGDRFYLGEMIAYVTSQTTPDISNFVIVPKQADQVFGSLFEIQSRYDELFVSGATVDDIEIVTAITANEINVSTENFVGTTQ
jgi:hypothetical protein